MNRNPTVEWERTVAAEPSLPREYPRSLALRDGLLIASFGFNNFILWSVAGPAGASAAGFWTALLPYLGIIFNTLVLFTVLVMLSRSNARAPARTPSDERATG